ncbi:hypothetical protein U1Q18_018905 [Sarracenia purpurea var. burkii]
MFEESVASIPSIWASMNSWLTPTVLFVLLNLMIGTIAFTSSLATQKHHHQDHQQPTKLPQAPSLLQRLTSINLYGSRSLEPNYSSPPITTTPQLNHPTQDSDTHYAPLGTHPLETETQRVFPRTYFEEQPEKEAAEEEEEEESPTLDEIYSQLKGRQVNRTNSDTVPASGAMPERLPTKMRKSASTKSAFAHFEEDDIVEVRRPATVREGDARVTEADDEVDAEVDAKADDFINRFKQQLKLQKLDSIMRYKEMISRGSEK